MTVVEAGCGVGNANDGLCQHRERISHRLRERTPQIKREVAVAIIGEAVGDAGRFVSHVILLQPLEPRCKPVPPAQTLSEVGNSRLPSMSIWLKSSRARQNPVWQGVAS